MKSPAFQWYPTDYLGSQRVQMMSLEEEGAYCRLLWYCWQHGSIPADPDQAARLIGKGCSRVVAESVLKMFQPGPESGRLVHDRLEEERKKQELWRLKSSAGGKKSAEMRSKGGSRVVQGWLENGCNQKATLQSPTPSSILLIYESYPKKVDKPQALRAIKKAVVEFGYALVFERTKAYAEARVGEDPKYTPTPAKWFNGQRFNDDPSTWKNGQQTTKPTAPGGGMMKSPDGTLFKLGAF